MTKVVKYYRIIKTTLMLIPVVILTVLVYKDFCPSGQLEMTYNFCHDSPFFSRLSPLGRVLEIEKFKKYCAQKMIIDPVYFDVRLPQSFDQAELTVWYQKSSPETPLRIGPRRNPEEWSWDLQDINFRVSDENDRSWSVGTARFDISSVRLDKNRLRFLISSPSLDTSGEDLFFKQIQIKFTKPPLSWNKLGSRARDFLGWSGN